MSLGLQAKLLRVIQERKIRRVGGEMEIPVDVRWVSATNRDPEEAVREGRLRPELYFRLNVVPIRVPSLRERREDIPLLTEHFLARFGRDYGRPTLRLADEVVQSLTDYEWPGNVRELQNVVERMVSLRAEGEVSIRELPEELERAGRRWSGPGPARIGADRPFHEAKSRVISDFEKAYLRDLLVSNRCNISEAARRAGIDRKTIHRMIAKYELGPIA